MKLAETLRGASPADAMRDAQIAADQNEEEVEVWSLWNPWGHSYGLYTYPATAPLVSNQIGTALPSLTRG